MLGLQVTKGAHGAAELADTHVLGCRVETGQVALHLRVPIQQLQAKGRRFRMNSVGAADGGRVLELDGAALEHGEQGSEARLNQRGSLRNLQRLRRIHDVIGGEPIVQPAGLGVESLSFKGLGDSCGESDHVVLHLRLDLLNARDCEGSLGRNSVGGGSGNHAVLSQHGAGRRLHLEPAAVFILFSPDAAHCRAGIAVDQGKLLQRARLPQGLKA